jgi:hypothetical protein
MLSLCQNDVSKEVFAVQLTVFKRIPMGGSNENSGGGNTPFG